MSAVQVSNSYDDPAVVPADVLGRYVWLETGNAAAILQATSTDEFNDLISVLRDFDLDPDAWLVKGGNRGDIAADLDSRFRTFGWKETRIDTSVQGIFFTEFVHRGRDYVPTVQEEVPSVYSEGFRVDNHKGRMIVDIEWNARTATSTETCQLIAPGTSTA